MKTSKVLFVLDTLNGGGFERRVSQLIIGISPKNEEFKIYVLLPKGTPIDYQETLNTNCTFLEYHSNKEFINIIKNIHPDIVHSCSPYKSLIINIIKPIFGFKYIVGFIADANRPNLLSKRNLGFICSYPFADAIVGNSKAGIEAYRCPKKKSYVIYNGFDPLRLKCELREDLKKIRESYKYVISMVARMEDDKDYIAYINLASKFIDRADTIFLIAGKGRNESFLKEYCNTNHINNVLFIGFRKDVINVYKISNVSLLLTKIGKHKEGVSNSIMESMAVGTPVIATKDGGTLEIIKDSVNGYLIDNNNIYDILCILNKNLTDENSFSCISNNAKETIKNHFLLSRMVDNYINLYRNI